MTRLFTQIIFVLVFMAGQFAYAEHNADVLSGEHNHGVDCTLCLSQVNESAAVAQPDLSLYDAYAAVPVGVGSAVIYPAFVDNYAPPAPLLF